MLEEAGSSSIPTTVDKYAVNGKNLIIGATSSS
jgi:hypothetical protein